MNRSASGRSPEPSERRVSRVAWLALAITVVSLGLAGAEIPELGWPDPSDDPDALRRFYEARGSALAWSRGGRPTAQARAVADLLDESAAKGLSPADYAAPGWRERIARLGTSAGPAELARFDRMLTASLLRYASDLRRGRVDPRCLGAHFDPGLDPAWGEPGEPDLAAVAAEVAAAADPAAPLAALEPPFPGYRRLLAGLSRYRELPPAESDRASKIELTLERWRWAPRRLERPPVVVNVPEFRLRAFDAAGEVAFTTEVIVGEACRHQTPIFTAPIEAVVFRPAWYVPTSIARGEILPAAARDPGYLARKGYQIVGREGETPTPALLAAVADGTLRLRQRPGPDNALGLVKLQVRSRYAVHLHDTPAPALFAEPRRDLSHGCIRVADPAGLALWALRDVAGWDAAAIDRAMHGSRDELAVPLEPPIPVLVAYATAVAPEDGELLFFDDLYGHDARLRDALERGRPYPRLGACAGGSG
jgi:murein L,D-transpeptidase YcbB/YkuD